MESVGNKGEKTQPAGRLEKAFKLLRNLWAGGFALFAFADILLLTGISETVWGKIG